MNAVFKDLDNKELKEILKERIVTVIRKIGDYSLAALAVHPEMDDLSKGTLMYQGKEGRKRPNILYLKNVNIPFIQALEELSEANIIQAHPMSAVAASMDGVLYSDLPIAEGENFDKYTSMHWLPVSIKAGKNFPW